MQRLTQFKLRPPNFNILSFYSLLSCVSSQKMAIDCNLYLRCEQKF